MIRPVPSYPHLSATSEGEIIGVRGRPLSPRIRGKYLSINTNVSGKHITVSVHRLVCEAFHGPCPAGQETAHNNGVKTDNRADNLRWDTRPGNMADKLVHGTMYQGTRHDRAKVSEDQVRSIRSRWTAGETQISLASAYGLAQSQIGRICRRESWKHL